MNYELVATECFEKDFAFLEQKNSDIARKICKLLESIQINPRAGIGKPERLKYFAPDEVWSRRITLEHRLVYRIEKNYVYLLQARYHY